MLNYRKIYTHIEPHAETEKRSFVVDIHELGVRKYAGDRPAQKPASCAIFLVTGPESDEKTWPPERAHWIK